ncbi:MAG: phage protease [Opitutales bacterium]|nr:phage protease [Opitutales bacterium]
MKTNRASLFSAFATPGEAPDWIHLIPAGQFQANDGRGPFRMADPAAVIAASLQPGGMLPIDQDHATDLAAKQGGEAPARGWIVEMEAREDGIWGRVEWTGKGKELLADRAYRGVSPVFLSNKDGDITRILRAALTNDPALTQLTTLMHGNDGMDLKKSLASLFGMDDDADDKDIMSAVEEAVKASKENKEAASRVAKAVGLDAGVSVDTLVTTLAARQAQASDVETLRNEVADLKIELASSKASTTKVEAERVVDAAIAEGKPIKAQRATWIELMSSDPDKTKVALAAIPSIKGEALGKSGEPKKADGLDDVEKQVCAMMGVTPEQFIAARAGGIEIGG